VFEGGVFYFRRYMGLWPNYWLFLVPGAHRFTFFGRCRPGTPVYTN
jgi:hypothetical protein